MLQKIHLLCRKKKTKCGESSWLQIPCSPVKRKMEGSNLQYGFRVSKTWVTACRIFSGFVLSGHFSVALQQNETVMEEDFWDVYHFLWGEFILLILCALLRNLWRAKMGHNWPQSLWGKIKTQRNDLLLLLQYLVYTQP